MNYVKKILSKIPVGVKSSVAFCIASFISAGMAYITTPLYTRLLTTDEFGKVSVFLTWLQIFGIVAMFSLSAGVFNTGMIDYPDKRDEYSFSMLTLSNLITIIFSVVLLTCYPIVSSFINVDFPLIVLMCIIFFLQPAYNMWITRQRFEYKYKSVLLWASICAISSPIIALCCIYFTNGSRLYARILGAEIPLLIIYSFFYIKLGLSCRFRIEKKYWKAAFLFNLPLIPHYLSSNLLASSDKLMISAFISDTATAYYSIANNVASVAMIIWSSINAALVPYVYQKCKETDYDSINKITIPILTLFAVCCVGIIMLAPEVVWMLATAEYQESIFAIPPIVGGVFFQVQYFIYANILYYQKKPKYVMVGSIVSFCVNFLLNYFCIPRYGYIAAGYTTLVSYVIQAIINYLAMKRAIPEHIYDMKYIFVLSIIVVVISLTSNWLYSYMLVRYLVIFSILLFLFFLRKKIIGYFVIMKNK